MSATVTRIAPRWHGRLQALSAAALLLAGCRVLGPSHESQPTPGGASFLNAGPAATVRQDTATPASPGFPDAPVVTPATAVSAATTAGRQAGGPVAAADADHGWWNVFGDAQLDRLIASALEASPALEVAAARVAEARARLGIADADRFPSATASGNARLAGETAERSLPVPGRPVTYRDSGDSYRLSLDIGWEPDLWGRVRRAREAATAQLGASEADARAVRLALVSDVSAAYSALRGLEEEERLLRRTLLLRAEATGLLAVRSAAGLAADSDVHRSRAEEALVSAELADLGRRRGLALNALALLCGTTVSELQLQPTAPLPLPPAVPPGIPAEVLRRRPDIAAAEAQLHARTAEIGVAEAARYPSLRLTAGGGFESADLGSLLGRPSQFWQLGPAFSWPVLEGGRTKAAIRSALARAEAARAEHRQRCLVALREVEDALVELRQLAGQGTALDAGSVAAAEAARLLKVRHEAGLVSHLEVLDAERTVLQLDRARVQNSAARLAATIRLIRALGGAW